MRTWLWVWHSLSFPRPEKFIKLWHSYSKIMGTVCMYIHVHQKSNGLPLWLSKLKIIYDSTLYSLPISSTPLLALRVHPNWQVTWDTGLQKPDTTIMQKLVIHFPSWSSYLCPTNNTTTFLKERLDAASRRSCSIRRQKYTKGIYILEISGSDRMVEIHS